MYYKTTGYKVFNLFNMTLLLLLAVLCILPMIHILAVSLSSKAPAAANMVGLWPVGFTLEAYGKTFANENFINSMTISATRAVTGTLLGMSVIILAAYPLSKSSSRFKGRSGYTWYFVVTMLISGGLIPSYILIQKLGLMNSIWALILPPAVNVWNLILLLNFFRNVPKEMEEAAHIDGAGHWATLFRIFLPVSLPALATLSLFALVFHWNSWFDGLIYMTDSRRYPLSTLLQTIVVQQDFSNIKVDPSQLENLSQRTVQASQIFIGALPILVIYPFLQRFFVKGIVLGAVKE